MDSFKEASRGGQPMRQSKHLSIRVMFDNTMGPQTGQVIRHVNHASRGPFAAQRDSADDLPQATLTHGLRGGGRAPLLASLATPTRDIALVPRTPESRAITAFLPRWPQRSRGRRDRSAAERRSGRRFHRCPRMEHRRELRKDTAVHFRSTIGRYLCHICTRNWTHERTHPRAA